jgi:hypothetical protein
MCCNGGPVEGQDDDGEAPMLRTLHLYCTRMCSLEGQDDDGEAPMMRTLHLYCTRMCSLEGHTSVRNLRDPCGPACQQENTF